VHPQYLLQASRDQREYGWSKLNIELHFSWGARYKGIESG
jgi:hypothetical protein